MFRPESAFMGETTHIKRANFRHYMCIIYVLKHNILQVLIIEILKNKEKY
jgi:hypothetical protein